MGTNTGIGIGIGIPFKNNALGGDRPYLPPELKARLIGVWDNYGKKNTDADRNIIKNKIPNAGGDLEILNAAYKLNSGFGEYKEDFTSWRIYPNIEVTDNVITTNGNFNSTWFIYKHANENEINEMNIKVSGIPEGGIIRYFYIPDETATMPVSYNISEDGVYHLPKSKLSSNRVSVGFTVSSSYDWNNIRIEQLSDFGGAFVTDGINDIIISQKTLQEMGVTKDFTIVSMIHQISWRGSGSVPLTNYIRPTDNIYVRNQVADIGKTGIYGYVIYDVNNTSVNNSRIINTVLGDKNDYSIYTVGNLSQGKFSVQGYISSKGNIIETSRVAHYWTFALLGKATEDDINLIIAYFNLDRTLRPDILCNITKQGITNDNHADFNDKLVDYSGNGRDIQMYNLAWKGSSGVAAKKFETIKDYLIVPDEGLQELTIYNEFSYKVKSIKYADRYWTIQTLNKTDVSYPITIVSDKNIIWRNAINYTDENGVKRSIRKETNVPANTPTQVFVLGFNDFDVPDNYTKVNCVAYATRTDITEFTVIFIPSCKGGILLDGIEDFGKVTGMPIYKDYTVIADYERFYLEPITGGRASILSKSSKVGDGSFIFNLEDQDGGKACYTFGEANGNISDDITRIIRYQSKYYNTKTLSISTAEDNDFMVLGKVREVDSRHFCGAIYSLMSFPYSMSEFLIERQLKKHKLGTLYPNMVEFRPIIKSSVELVNKPTFVIRGSSTLLNAGDYVPENSQIWVSIKMNNAADRITKFTVNGKTIDIPENAYSEVTLQYGFPFVIDKSPQKIGITIEQDENYVLFNPVINSNYDNYKLTFHLREYEKLINIGDYIPKGTYIRANLYLKNNIDELVTFTFNGVNIDYAKSPVLDTAYNIRQIYNYDSPQEVNITIDEYIRYEDIVQPYPVIFQITDRNTNQRYSWGDKIKVGSSIRLSQGEKPNLLSGLYSIQSYEYEGETYSYNQLTNLNIILTKQSISLSCNKTWLLDDNEPKCILSPRLLRIPNSSYKILGYIPDISGHGNHGVIHNSAYAEGSGVNEDGSYQFDGVDDFVTIPTITGGKQVLMKVNWQSITGMAILYDQRTNGGFAIFNRDYDTNENKVPAYRARNIGGNTYIDGILNEYIYASQLQNITHNIVELYDPELNIGTLNPKIGSSYLNSSYAQMSLYDFMLFDEISTEAKIKELNTYIGITPKVTLPNYYWDNYGKKNTDANRGHVDEQVSLQKTGTSVNPLENFNISYEGMSGYNGYPVVFGASKTWESLSDVYGYTSNVTNTTIHVTHAEHAGYGLLFSYVKKDGALANIKEIPAFRVTVGGLEGNSKFGYRYLATEDATEETLVYLGNGTHELAKSFAPTEALLDLTRNVWVGIFITPMIEGEVVFDCDITIEVLPEYENGLAYDGVSDFSQNTEIEVVEDFTFLVKGSLLKGLTGSGGCIARKGDKKHYDTGGYAFIYCFDSPIESYRNSYYSFGKSFVPSKEIVAPPLIGYMTKTNVNGETTTFGTNSDIKGIIFGNWSSGYMNMVIYKSIFYTKTISLLEINFLKNLMEKDEIIDINHPIFISNTEDESNTSQDT
jgi:hypothetical protein